MIDLIISNLIGFLIGVTSSFLVWYYLFRVLVPRIVFSEKISKIKREDPPPKYNYRIKFQNRGKRAIIDVDIKIKLRIKGLFKNRPSTWKEVSIPTSIEENPIIKPQKIGGQIVNFGIMDCDFFTSNLVEEEVRENFLKRTLSLEDILSLGSGTELHVIIGGYDEFSGARKIFVSKLYRKDDIVGGQFEKETLQIIIIKT